MSDNISFAAVLAALSDDTTAFPAKYARHLSDLGPSELAGFQKTWGSLPVARRRRVVHLLVQQFQKDDLLSYDELAAILMNDPDVDVRAGAVQLVSETQNVHMAPRLLDVLNLDTEDAPRIAAAQSLAQFVEMGELEELPAGLYQEIRDSLMRASATSNNAALQRAVIESLGFANRPDVEVLLENAYRHHDPAWIASALVGMGRSANSRWQGEIIESLANLNPAVRLAAVNATSELRLATAREILINMMEEEDDEDVFRAIIWSLSCIGGEDTRTYLETLADQTEDDDLLEYIEEALANLAFTEDLDAFEMLSFDPEEDENGKNG